MILAPRPHGARQRTGRRFPVRCRVYCRKKWPRTPINTLEVIPTRRSAERMPHDTAPGRPRSGRKPAWESPLVLSCSLGRTRPAEPSCRLGRVRHSYRRGNRRRNHHRSRRSRRYCKMATGRVFRSSSLLTTRPKPSQAVSMQNFSFRASFRQAREPNPETSYGTISYIETRQSPGQFKQ
jgi:hypothetical protein